MNGGPTDPGQIREISSDGQIRIDPAKLATMSDEEIKSLMRVSKALSAAGGDPAALSAEDQKLVKSLTGSTKPDKTPERDAPKPVCRRRSASLSGIWTRQDPAVCRWGPLDPVVAGADLAKDFGPRSGPRFPGVRFHGRRRSPGPPPLARARAATAVRQGQGQGHRRSLGLPPLARGAAARQGQGRRRSPGPPSLARATVARPGPPSLARATVARQGHRRSPGPPPASHRSSEAAEQPLTPRDNFVLGAERRGAIIDLGGMRMESDRESHIGRLFSAELQFRLATAVRHATTLQVQPLDVPTMWTHGQHSVGYEEIILRQEQADYAAWLLSQSATYLMAVAVKDAIRAVVPDPKSSSDSGVRAAYQVSRMIRNAFAHAPFSPVWSIDQDCRDRIFAIPGLISLDTTGRHGTALDWRHYGGPLALLRLCKFVRLEILDHKPESRTNIPPQIHKSYQQGNLLMTEVDEAPAGAVAIEAEPRTDSGIVVDSD